MAIHLARSLEIDWSNTITKRTRRQWFQQHFEDIVPRTHDSYASLPMIPVEQLLPLP